MVLEASDLIIVCCHGIWLGGPSLGADEAEWLIAPYQHGETPTFVEHLKSGLRLFLDNPRSLLMLSGGPTRPETPVSEAESYARLAQLHDYWGLLSTSGMAERVTKEERSLDSFHNLLFSLTKFYEMTGRWPYHVTIISNEFKRSRFLDLHCKAIRWPLERVTFVGIDPAYMAADLERAASVREGERRNGFEAWERDILGTGEVLEGKRVKRNPWQVGQLLFEDVEAKKRSKVDSRMIQYREILGDGPQPWEWQ